jgi:pilus assembly protein CpaE
MQLAIVTDFEYRAQVVDQILMERGWQLLACVGQAHPRTWLMQQQGVEMVLVDLDTPDAISLLKELTQVAPHLPLVALATPQRIVELQDAMLAGATNFIAFPIDPKQFIATLERARNSAMRTQHAAIAHPVAPTHSAHHGSTRRNSKVIVVTSLKGGVGRSTIAANVAVALRQRTNKNVVLVEAHHGLGHLALLLNLYPRHTIESLDGEFDLDLDLLQGLLQSHGSGIRLLAAPVDPSQLVELPVEIWQRIIHLLKDTADYVVVDTSAHADGVLSEMLAQATEILLVTGSDIAGLRDARILLHSLRHESVVEGRIHVVLNRAGSQGGIDERIVQEQLREPVAVSIPEDSALATFSFNRGVPFVMGQARALMSRRLQALVDRLVVETALATVQAPAQRPSFFSFLNLVGRGA